MALQTPTLPDALREKLHAALIPARHAFFWGEWVFRLLFVGPAVCLCLVLAISSHFSFEKLASDALLVIASMERSPAPPADGFVTLGGCKDPARIAEQKPSPATVCKTTGWEQTPIVTAASKATEVLWEMYAIGVFITAGLCLTMGPFERSRNAFLASLKESRPRVHGESGHAGASNEASV